MPPKKSSKTTKSSLTRIKKAASEHVKRIKEYSGCNKRVNSINYDLNDIIPQKRKKINEKKTDLEELESNDLAVEQAKYIKDLLAKIDQLEKEKKEASENKPIFFNEKIPEFSGKDDEDYEAWELQIKIFLSQFKNIDEKKQIEIITMGVSGQALKLLKIPSRSLNTKEDIFSILRETFGNSKPIIGELEQLKQREQETVQNYFTRLNTQFKLRYPDPDSMLYNDYLFIVFRAGLKPNIQELLNCSFPQDITSAYKKARVIERDISY